MLACCSWVCILVVLEIVLGAFTGLTSVSSDVLVVDALSSVLPFDSGTVSAGVSVSSYVYSINDFNSGDDFGSSLVSVPFSISLRALLLIS